jgi:probable phosphomutase (TIGR03848 family)
MSTLLLIRHGENDFLKNGILIGNTPGVHLNHDGRNQAIALSNCLLGTPIHAILSSPLDRAIETATPLANALELEIHIRPALTDTNIGEWTGKKIKDLRKLPLWEQVQTKPSQFRFPGGESFVELQERLTSEVDAIAAAYGSHKTVAIFFHADPIELVLAHYLGLPLDHFQRFTVDTGSVTVLKVNKSKTQLVALNLKPPFHLSS